MSTSVANICFHGIGTPARELEPGEARYWISVQQYHDVLDEICSWGPPEQVRISFDDGNTSDIAIGLPGLVARGLRATFFPVAARLPLAGSLDPEHLTVLVAAGMGIGTHGMWHRPWRGLSAAQQHEEWVLAREQIAAAAGVAADEAALPLGRYDRQVLSSLRRLGYRTVYSSDRRRTDPSAWLQPRFSVTCDDTPATVRAAALDRPPLRRALRDQAVGLVKRLR